MSCEISNSGAGHGRQITVDGGLRTGASGDSRSASGAKRVRAKGAVDGMKGGILIKMTGVAHVVGVVSEQVVSAYIADVIRTEYSRLLNLFLETNVHLNRARRLVIRRQHTLAA